VVRTEEKAEAVQGALLKLASLRALRGLALPQFCPPGPPPMGIVPIPTVALLGPCADTTSSSSAARAEDPRTRLGLGERRLGDPEPELAPSPFPPPAVGRAIGAIGRVIGPGPEASLLDAWRPWPGARLGEAVPCVADFAAFAGGPIGIGERAPKGTPTPIGIPRLKVGSKDPPLKPRAGTGLNGGGCGIGPPYPYVIGGKLPTRGDIKDGDIPTGA
jgi:hypothetical protein